MVKPSHQPPHHQQRRDDGAAGTNQTPNKPSFELKTEVGQQQHPTPSIGSRDGAVEMEILKQDPAQPDHVEVKNEPK